MNKCPKCGYIYRDKRRLQRYIRLYTKEGLTQHEIASLLDISQGYVSKILHRKLPKAPNGSTIHMRKV